MVEYIPTQMEDKDHSIRNKNPLFILSTQKNYFFLPLKKTHHEFDYD